MTTVNSPRGLPRCDATSAGRADQYLLVALGELASGSHRGGGHPLARAPRAGPPCGAAPRTAPAAARRTPPAANSRSSALARADAGRDGRKPPNTNPCASTPDRATAAVTAAGPGTTSTEAPASRAAATSVGAGVRDAGHTRVGRQRQRLAGGEPCQQAGKAAGAVVLVEGLRRRARSDVGEQPRGQPRVLGHDQVGRPQRLGGTWGQVAQVADRRADDQEPARASRRAARRRAVAGGRGGRSPACAG